MSRLGEASALKCETEEPGTKALACVDCAVRQRRADRLPDGLKDPVGR